MAIPPQGSTPNPFEYIPEVTTQEVAHRQRPVTTDTELEASQLPDVAKWPQVPDIVGIVL